jgi:hypothetical protein
LVDVTNLRIRANRDAIELGPNPADPHDRVTWGAERYGAAVILATLADHDRELLRRVAADELVSTGARDLLLAAAQDSC